MAYPIGVTKGLTTWRFSDQNVERLMDNAAYSAAHPDDTLVLAGPARKQLAGDSGANGKKTLLAIGMLQGVQFSQTKPTQPMLAIGSGRSFFVSGKSQTQWSIARLWVNGRNLLRVLYHNARQVDAAVDTFDDPAALSGSHQFYTNLDSELFYVPFGLGTIIRSKSHDFICAFYAELSMITSWSMGVNAGQNMVMENVTGLSDRILPWSPADEATNGGADQKTLDAILGFTDNSENKRGYGEAELEDDLN